MAGRESRFGDNEIMLSWLWLREQTMHWKKCRKPVRDEDDGLPTVEVRDSAGRPNFGARDERVHNSEARQELQRDPTASKIRVCLKGAF